MTACKVLAPMFRFVLTQNESLGNACLRILLALHTQPQRSQMSGGKPKVLIKPVHLPEEPVPAGIQLCQAEAFFQKIWWGEIYSCSCRNGSGERILKPTVQLQCIGR